MHFQTPKRTKQQSSVAKANCIRECGMPLSSDPAFHASYRCPLITDEALKMSTIMVSTAEISLHYFTRCTRCKDMALFVYSDSSLTHTFHLGMTPRSFQATAAPTASPNPSISTISSPPPSPVEITRESSMPVVQSRPHGKRRDPSYIPRPPNAFILFRSAFIREQNIPGKVEGNHSKLSKIIGSSSPAIPTVASTNLVCTTKQAYVGGNSPAKNERNGKHRRSLHKLSTELVIPTGASVPAPMLWLSLRSAKRAHRRQGGVVCEAVSKALL